MSRAYFTEQPTAMLPTVPCCQLSAALLLRCCRTVRLGLVPLLVRNETASPLLPLLARHKTAPLFLLALVCPARNFGGTGWCAALGGRVALCFYPWLSYRPSSDTKAGRCSCEPLSGTKLYRRSRRFLSDTKRYRCSFAPLSGPEQYRHSCRFLSGPKRCRSFFAPLPGMKRCCR